MAEEATGHKQWWMGVLRDQFRARGVSLSKRPSGDELCYYGNPLGALAVDWGLETSDRWQMPADTCRDWHWPDLPNLWSALENLASDWAGLTRSIERLWVFRSSGCHAMPLMGLCEWMAAFERVCECLANQQPIDLRRSAVSACMSPLVADTSRFGRLHATGWSGKLFLTGYCLAMERAATGLGLSEDDWMVCQVLPKDIKSGKSMAYQWRDIPPYAALVLLEWVRGQKWGETRQDRNGLHLPAARGADNLVEILRAIAGQGGRVDSPGYVRDIKKYVPALNKAMAIDRYLYENPKRMSELIERMHVDERAKQRYEMVQAGINFDPLTRLIDVMALHWQGGFPPIGQRDAQQRFAGEGLPGQKSAMAVASDIEVEMLGDVEPRIHLRLCWDKDELPLPDDFLAVVCCEAWEGRTALTDDMFMDVNDVVWADEPGHITVTLEVTKWNCLLYEWPRVGKRPNCSGTLWAKESVDWPTPVIGLRIFMGQLAPKNQVLSSNP